jgi:hypothetical protein
MVVYSFGYLLVMFCFMVQDLPDVGIFQRLETPFFEKGFQVFHNVVVI